MGDVFLGGQALFRRVVDDVILLAILFRTGDLYASQFIEQSDPQKLFVGFGAGDVGLFRSGAVGHALHGQGQTGRTQIFLRAGRGFSAADFA